MKHKVVDEFNAPPGHASCGVPPNRPTDIPTGSETVLFVDDEILLVQLNTNLLERIGYEPISCTSAQQALARFREDPYGYDLLITDLLMPGMDGLDLAAACKRLRPEIPVVICSGQSQLNAAHEHKVNHLNIDGILFKPFTLKDLAVAVRGALDRHQS